jgi:predicted acylesterase/phospholipase RssA
MLRQLLYAPQPATKAKTNLVLLHATDALPQNTAIWLQNHPNTTHHHHVCPHLPAHLARLARILGGKCIGLVLGGGGARGLAHIGIIKALRQHNVPIDAVGGTSMGALIGTAAALGWDTDTIETLCKKNLSNWKLLKDYTLPTVSMVTGRTADTALQNIFGDIQIENTWLNYFCVSSNLTNCEIEIHQHGSLAQALRASVSLPVIFPPVIQNQKMLIDGGLMNNLPADIMYQKMKGKTIIADVMPQDNLDIIGKKKPSLVSFILEKTLSIPQKNRTPDILEIIMRASLLNSSQKTKHLRQYATLFLQPPVKNFGLLEMASISKIADIGYQYTHEMLNNLPVPINELLEI